MTHVVLISGLQSDSVSWQGVPDCLSSAHDVTVPHGFQYADSMAGMADAIHAQLPPRFHLVGWSMGGYIALELMRRMPERISALVMMNTSAAAEPPEGAEKRRQSLDIAETHGLAYYQLNNLDRCLHDPASLSERARQELAAASESLGIDAFRAQLRAIVDRPDSRPDLALVRCPALIVTSDDDRVVDPSFSRDMHRRLPGSDFVEIQNCGHCPPMEAPAKLCELLLDWFAGVGDQPPPQP